MTTLPDRRAQGPFPLPLPLQILNAQPDCDNHPEAARHIVTIHQCDCCDTGDLSPDGALIHLLCTQCVDATTQLIGGYVKRRIERQPAAARSECTTCGRPVAGVSDVMEVEAL